MYVAKRFARSGKVATDVPTEEPFYVSFKERPSMKLASIGLLVV